MKYLSIAFLSFTVSVAAAQENTFALQSNSSNNLEMPGLVNSSIPLYPGKVGRGNTDINRCGTLDLGWSNSSFSDNGKKRNGNGIYFHYATGAAFQRSGNGARNIDRAFCIEIAYTGFRANFKASDTTIKYRFNYLGFPISYWRMNYLTSTGGIFYQGSVNVNVAASESDGSNDITKQFRDVAVFPSISCGYGIVADPRISVTGKRTKSQIICIGLFISYGVNNVSKDDNAGFHALTYGIKTFSMMVD